MKTIAPLVFPCCRKHAFYGTRWDRICLMVKYSPFEFNPCWKILKQNSNQNIRTGLWYKVPKSTYHQTQRYSNLQQVGRDKCQSGRPRHARRPFEGSSTHPHFPGQLVLQLLNDAGHSSVVCISTIWRWTKKQKRSWCVRISWHQYKKKIVITILVK